jgi:hypothetical protein
MIIKLQPNKKYSNILKSKWISVTETYKTINIYIEIQKYKNNFYVKKYLYKNLNQKIKKNNEKYIIKEYTHHSKLNRDINKNNEIIYTYDKNIWLNITSHFYVIDVDEEPHIKYWDDVFKNTKFYHHNNQLASGILYAIHLYKKNLR